MEEKERYIRRTDREFPEKLRQIKSVPKGLYVRGQLPSADQPAIAIIGARRCSSYGKRMAEWFAGELAAAGVQIVSGMAAGVDGIAQRAALRAGGKSYGVLGCGTDICYPPENRDLYETLLRCGGILSEYVPGTPPDAFRFPARNRIISGVSDAVLVVEAKERSGTLITVDFALEQGREVFVLPGRITDDLSAGCNRLLRQGAGVVLAPSDILGEMRSQNKWHTTMGNMEDMTCASELKVREKPEGRERLVWEKLDARPQTVQELYDRLHAELPQEAPKMAELNDLLMRLLLDGWAEQEHANTYLRADREIVSSI